MIYSFNMNNRIILITGVPGSGKSTVTDSLCKLFDKSIHIPVDTLRQMVKGGYASPENWNEEFEKQYKLARKNASSIANNAVEEGFVVVIDDIVKQEWINEWRNNLSGYELKFVLLNPDIETIKNRNKQRKQSTVPEDFIVPLYEKLSRENTLENGWICINNTELSVEETAREIFKLIS